MITDSDIWLELEKASHFDSGVVHVKFIDRDCSESIDTYICLVYKDDKDHPGTLVTQRNFDIIRHSIDVMEDVNVTKLYIREGPKINIAQQTTKDEEAGVVWAPYRPVTMNPEWTNISPKVPIVGNVHSLDGKITW